MPPALKKATTLRNVALDKSSDKSVAVQLRDTLSQQAVRVIDLFREWDEDGDGTVSKKEFRKAMPLLGLGDISRDEIDKLFDEWDPDGSGSLELKELNKCLRRGAEVQLDASMQAGAAGEIKLKAETKHQLRKGPSRGTTLRKIDLDEQSGKSYAAQLRDALTEQAVRVIDLFREWDEDGDGEVSKAEFRRAMPLLGLDVPRDEIDKLFDEWDPDGSGTIELRELNKFLRRGMAEDVHRPWIPGAVGNKLMLSEAFQARLKAADEATLATSSFASTVASLQEASPLLARPPRNAKHRYRAVSDSEAPNSDGTRRGSPPRRPPSHVEVLQAAAKEGLRLVPKNCTSGWQGVYRSTDPRSPPFRAQAIGRQGQVIHLGAFWSDAEAALCYARYMRRLQQRTQRAHALLVSESLPQLALHVPAPSKAYDTARSAEWQLLPGTKVPVVPHETPVRKKPGEEDLDPATAPTPEEAGRRRLVRILKRNLSRVVDLFHAMDANGDGQISRAEFAGGLHDLKVAASDAEVAALFAKFDPDGSGFLSFRELHASLRDIPKVRALEIAKAKPPLELSSTNKSFSLRRGLDPAAQVVSPPPIHTHTLAHTNTPSHTPPPLPPSRAFIPSLPL